MSPPATLYKLFMSNSETAILKMLKDWSIDGKNSDKSSLEPKNLVQDQSIGTIRSRERRSTSSASTKTTENSYVNYFLMS